MADLARLAPESVLYNVMPVFTFMGSNVFHRDDTYSFKVVQQVHIYHIYSLTALTPEIDNRRDCPCHDVVSEARSYPIY